MAAAALGDSDYRPFSGLPDEMCLAIVFCLELHEAETMRIVSRRFARDNPLCYQRLAASRWRGKHMSTVRPLLRRLLDDVEAGVKTWREVFWRVESDGARDRITEDELVRLRWAFSDGAQTCDFRKDPATGERTLHMQFHGEMPWSINDNHAIQISRFPEHIVERLPNWGWVIKNQFIFILSIEENSADGDHALRCSEEARSPGQGESQRAINEAFLRAAREAGRAAAPLATGRSLVQRILHTLFLQAHAVGEGGQPREQESEDGLGTG